MLYLLGNNVLFISNNEILDFLLQLIIVVIIISLLIIILLLSFFVDSCRHINKIARSDSCMNTLLADN